VPKGHAIHGYRQAVALAAKAAGLEEATAPQLPRPDVDNLGKAVLDALQEVIGDDTNVSRLVVEKSWGTEGRTTVRVT